MSRFLQFVNFSRPVFFVFVGLESARFSIPSVPPDGLSVRRVDSVHGGTEWNLFAVKSPFKTLNDYAYRRVNRQFEFMYCVNAGKIFAKKRKSGDIRLLFRYSLKSKKKNDRDDDCAVSTNPECSPTIGKKDKKENHSEQYYVLKNKYRLNVDSRTNHLVFIKEIISFSCFNSDYLWPKTTGKSIF